MRLILSVIALAVPSLSAAQEPVGNGVLFAPMEGRLAEFAENGPAGPFYPERARSAGKAGVAVLDCTAAANGVLERCKIVSEAPRRYDFGAAARVMAEKRWIIAAPPYEVGQPVRVSVPFELAD